MISSFFADIFKNNALNNALLPVQVTDDFLQKIFRLVGNNHKSPVTVDLPKQTVVLEDGTSEIFEINAYKKSCMMNGYDDIDIAQPARRDPTF